MNVKHSNCVFVRKMYTTQTPPLNKLVFKIVRKNNCSLTTHQKLHIHSKLIVIRENQPLLKNQS